MEPLPSLLAVDLAEAGGRWRWGREGQRGAHFPSPPGSILPVLPALAAQLPAGTGCTHLLLVEKFRAFFSLHLNIPELWGVWLFYEEDLIPFWTHDSLENCFRRKKLILSLPLSFSYCYWIKPLIQPEGLGCTWSEVKESTVDCSKSSGRDFLHRRILRENGHMERRKSKRTVHV